MLEGTKKLFPKDYEKFTEAMTDAANDHELPVTLQMDDVEDFTLKDFQDALYEFNRDTGLELSGSFFYCRDCGKMHIRLAVDWPKKEEGSEPVVQ